MSTATQRVIQQPALPWEITDAIIDHLDADVRALGTCSVVCSEWLTRSRYHIFSTVQLWPWRVRGFFDLAGSSMCTFVNRICRIEVDDSRTMRVDGGKDVQGANMSGEEVLLFSDAMSQSHIPCLAQVKTIHVQNVDWTALSLSQQATLRGRLGKFAHLNRLEFHGAVFHDLREVVRIVDCFPSLYHLTANITFMKYLEDTIASATTTHLSNNLLSVELGTDEAIPVVLNSIASREGPQSAMVLKLQNIKANHLQYIHTALRKSGKNLQILSLGFSGEGLSGMAKDDLVHALDFSHLSHLQTLRIEGLILTKILSVVEKNLAKVLECIESSFLESIELRFRLEAEAEVECIDWYPIERVLLAHHFFGMRFVNIAVEIQPGASLTEEQVEMWIRGGMNDLDLRGALNVGVARLGVVEEKRMNSSVSEKA